MGKPIQTLTKALENKGIKIPLGADFKKDGKGNKVDGYKISWNKGRSSVYITVDGQYLYTRRNNEGKIVRTDGHIGEGAVIALAKLLQSKGAVEKLQRAAKRFKKIAEVATTVAATTAATAASPVAGPLVFPIFFASVKAGAKAGVKAGHSNVGNNNSSTAKTIHRVATGIFRGAMSVATFGVSSWIGW